METMGEPSGTREAATPNTTILTEEECAATFICVGWSVARNSDEYNRKMLVSLLESLGIPISPNRVHIPTEQNNDTFLIQYPRRLIFGVDNETADRILRLFNGDVFDPKKFGRKLAYKDIRLFKKFTDMDAIRRNVMFVGLEHLRDILSAERFYSWEYIDDYIIFKREGAEDKIVTVEDLFIVYKWDYTQWLRHFNADGKVKIKKFAKEIIKKHAKKE